MSRTRRLRPLLVLLALGIAIGAAVAAVVWLTYVGSLPQTDGSLTLDGLSAPVTVERDARGIPTLRADDRRDLARACGFVHAQDRFFQMDLLRRFPAGELAALLGPALLEYDSHQRVHRFRHRAALAVEQLPPDQRALLDAYAAGVEQGRRSLRSKPFEYFLLRAEPEAWTPADTILVVFAMYNMLQDSNVVRERAQGLIAELLPPALAAFLSPAGSPWDAPLIGPAFDAGDVPPPEVIDLRKNPNEWKPGKRLDLPPDFVPGSNNWAVSGARTTHGGAIVACDMHLGLAAPSIWYRAAFVHQGRRIVGATLPGAPAMVVGSNGHVAWGFTNVEGDTSDQIILIDDKRPDHYLTPDGPLPLKKTEEVIRVNGGDARTIVVEETIWGPVIGRDRKGRRIALRWVAHEPGAVNLELMRLETASSVEEALTIAPRCGTPAQNLAVVDRKGHVGWTVLGRLPHRIGRDGRVPSRSDDPVTWEGFLPARLYPRLLDPPGGQVWTANNRTVDEPFLSRLGVGIYDHGARAQQIRDGLTSRPKVSEADMLAIQLDDRALFLTRWQQLMLDVLSDGARKDNDGRTALRRAVRDWGARAAPESAGFRAVRHFRREITDAVLLSLTAPCGRADPTFVPRSLDPNVEQCVYLLATKRPEHLLPPEHATWAALLLKAADRVVASCGRNPEAYTWGSINPPMIQHPLTPALGPLAKWMKLAMPNDPLPGDSRGMPRIQAPGVGASQRMAVSPGREEEGYFHAPAGQSGHPASPHFRDGHDDWASGRASPFLPGPAVRVLELRPR